MSDVPAESQTGVQCGGYAALSKRVVNGGLIGVPAIGAAFAVYYLFDNRPGWIEWSCFLGLYLFTGIGIGVGFHRCFTHQSFVPSSIVKFVLLLAGSLAFQGPVVRWVADHRRHHRFTDRAWDTHSPYWERDRKIGGLVAGLFHAHIGWMFDETSTNYMVYAPDLLKDRMVMVFHRWYFGLTLFSLGGPYLFGWALGGHEAGFKCLLLGGFVRAAMLHQVIWAINSIGHFLGERDASNRDHSRNNVLLAALSLGEGWHNNHHAFPRSAYNRWRWFQLDINGAIIQLLGVIGHASEIVTQDQSKFPGSPDYS